MRPIFIALFLTLITLLMDPTFAAKDGDAKRPGLVSRCSIYLGERSRGMIHRARYGRTDFRTDHNTKVLTAMLKQQRQGMSREGIVGMTTAIHQRFIYYQPHVTRFATIFRARQKVVESFAFIFATSPVYIYSADGSRYPHFYDAGVVLIVRERDKLLNRAVSTDMLDEVFNLRAPQARLASWGELLRDVDATGDDESSKLPSPTRFSPRD